MVARYLLVQNGQTVLGIYARNEIEAMKLLERDRAACTFWLLSLIFPTKIVAAQRPT